MVAYVFGASGDLGKALVNGLTEKSYSVKIVSRLDIENLVNGQKHQSNFEGITQAYFSIGQFTPGNLVETESNVIASEIYSNLVLPIQLCKIILESTLIDFETRRNFVFIGSTSAYEGFAKTSAYCAAKHGLVGFVKSMNKEFEQSNTRFWLASMGTMRGKMSEKVVGQDPNTFLDPGEVAQEIIARTTSIGNLFEPEILIRRRIVR